MIEYVTGLGRDYPHPRLSHLYELGSDGLPVRPMCHNGWNRDNGTAFSIWRGNVGSDGICSNCIRRAGQGLPGVEVRETLPDLSRLDHDDDGPEAA